ncbi:hypothetical protein D3C73_1380800 [compost metagenome]
MLDPTATDAISQGNLPASSIPKNLSGFIGVSPAIYTNKSLGSPGIRKKINKNTEKFFLSIISVIHLSFFFSINLPTRKPPINLVK